MPSKPLTSEEYNAQLEILHRVCRIVPEWNRRRDGRLEAVPYRIGRDTQVPGAESHAYSWFSGSRSLPHRTLAFMLARVLDEYERVELERDALKEALHPQGAQ